MPAPYKISDSHIISMRRTLFSLILSLLAASLLAADFAVGRPEGICLDGRLDESCWQSAPLLSGFSQLAATGLAQVQCPTDVRVLADTTGIYVGAVCWDTLPPVATLPPGTYTNVWCDSLLELFFAPTAGGDKYYQFAITAGGAVWMQYYEESGNTRPDPYMPLLDVSTGRGEGFWTLEIRIPLEAFYMTPASEWQSRWAVNFARYEPQRQDGRPAENTSWAPLKSDNHDVPGFHRLSGIPEKPAAMDLRVERATFKFASARDGRLAGRLSVDVWLGTAGAGRYTLLVDGVSVETRLSPGANQVEMPFSFEKEGRIPVGLALLDASGATVALRRYPVLVEAEAVSIRFISPRFAGNFYPGEEASRLQGSVSVPPDLERVTLTVAGTEYPLAVEDGRAEFDVDVSALSGDIPVSCLDVSRTVRHVPDARAWIRDGQVVVDGRPTWLRGWYGGPGWITSAAFEERCPTPESKQPVNFHGWINMEPGRFCGWDVEAEEMVFDREPSRRVLDAMSRMVEASRDSPLFCYYLCDEPECRGISPVYLRHLYRELKRQDPGRLVMIITREPVRYAECADILNPHPYLNPEVSDDGHRFLRVPVSRLRDTCASVEALKRTDKALLLTPQVFTYGFNNVYADYPTFDETNASIWSSVVHGGRGVTPFIWYDHASRPGLDLGCDFLYRSLERLEEMLTAPVQRRLAGDEGRLFRKGGKSLYVVVNVFPEERELSFETELPRLFAFRRGQEVTPDDGRVTLALKPYDVWLLTSEKMDEGLSTEQELRRQIDRAEFDRTHRGNLLFGHGRQVETSCPPSKPYDWQTPMEQQDKLFDGNIEVAAWYPRDVEGDLWYEMAFNLEEVPQFSQARIYGSQLQGMRFLIWKFGKWVEPSAVRTEEKYSLKLDFGTVLRTVKVRMEFQGRNPQLYEFELE